MVEIEIDWTKSVGENASIYFERTKKLKKKLEGAKRALAEAKEKLKKLAQKIEKERKEKRTKKERKKEWYEKFRWFFSSQGFLCIGGRDATTNEIVIKKYTEKDDLVFHADFSGAPFFVVKSQGKKIDKQSIEECGIAAGSFSKAWRLGLSYVDVYFVRPEQVSKKTKAGEYLTKGAFMIYGKKNYMKVELKLAVSCAEGKVISGPVEAVAKQTKNYAVIIPGNEKPSAIAKEIKKNLKCDADLDEIIRMLPPGESKIVKFVKEKQK